MCVSVKVWLGVCMCVHLCVISEKRVRDCRYLFVSYSRCLLPSPYQCLCGSTYCTSFLWPLFCMCNFHQPHHANKGKMCLKNCLSVVGCYFYYVYAMISLFLFLWLETLVPIFLFVLSLMMAGSFWTNGYFWIATIRNIDIFLSRTLYF